MLLAQSRKHIAIIIPGGVGTGKNNMGVPVIERIVKSLTSKYFVTVFQLVKANNDYKTDGFDLISIHSGGSLRKMVTFMLIFANIHRKHKFSIVHGFWALPAGMLAVVAGKIFGIKSIISLQGGDAISLPEINYGQLQSPIHRRFALWSLHNTDELICPTRFMYDNLVRIGLKPQSVHFIPIGIEPSLFTFREKEISKPVRFLHIGNFNRVKDQNTLLKAFRILSDKIDCMLTFVGEGELENDLKSLSNTLELNGKVAFMQHMPYEELPALYHQSDILLHTSLSEGHPIVVEEAMSCGVLVCGTAVGLLYELHDCCVSVPVKDYKALARLTLSLIGNPVQMKTQREKAKTWAHEHSLTWTIKKFIDLYENGEKI